MVGPITRVIIIITSISIILMISRQNSMAHSVTYAAVLIIPLSIATKENMRKQNHGKDEHKSPPITRYFISIIGTMTTAMSLPRMNWRVVTLYRIPYILTLLTDLKTLIGLTGFIIFTNSFKIAKRCTN